MNSSDFEFLYIVGRGGFGKVWSVKSKQTNKYYALKQMSKLKIIDKKSIKSINSERDLLSELYSPFIVNMYYAFQDKEFLYLVMDLLTGGDLRYHFCRIHRFTEEETKFFIGCLLLGLEYIHNNNIIHRDIKPENLVCDKNGYIRITDFGIAKINKGDNSTETSGTPGYMAPEVLLAKNYTFTVDFFAIGVIGYEFMLGKRPYNGSNRKQIKSLILKAQIKIDKDKVGWSEESVDFINRCLKRKESKRLGYTDGIEELKNHKWFNGFDWDGVYKKTILAPFVPKKEGNYDKSYCELDEKLGQDTKNRYDSYTTRKNYEKLTGVSVFIAYHILWVFRNTFSSQIRNFSLLKNCDSHFLSCFTVNSESRSAMWRKSAALKTSPRMRVSKPSAVSACSICSFDTPATWEDTALTRVLRR